MKRYSIFLIFLVFSIFIQFAWAGGKSSPASCTYKVTNGWTQTISFKCSSNINLNGTIIQFTVDNPAGLTNLNSVWGFINVPVYPTNPVLTLNGNTATLALNFSSNPVNLNAGTTTNFSYSTNNNVNVTSFALYPPGSSSNTGTLTFSQASGSNQLPADTKVTILGANTGFTTNIVYTNQTQINSVPYDTYQVTATGTVNGQPATIVVAPSQVTLDSTHTNLPISLSYASTAASLNVALSTAKPSDISNNSILVHVIDSTSTDHPINVPWGGQALLSGLTAGMQYTLSSSAINGQQNQYQFTFYPTSFVASKGQNNATVGVVSNPLPTGTANVTVTGLPASQLTSLFFTYNQGPSSQTITFNSVANGLHSYVLPAGYQYTLTTQNVFANGYRYSTSPMTLSIQSGSTTSINLPFTQTLIQGVNGWPNYIAMGAVTDDTSGSTTAFQTRPVDAIFKYAGLGGNGDPGQIIYPIFDVETANQAQTVTAYYQKNGISNIVKPVMVIYTAQMSGGTSFTDFEYTNLVMHYITLMIESQKLESYKTTQNPYPASIILNPDLFGMIQQENLLPQLNTAIGNVSLQNALKTAVCFITHTINTQYGQNLNYEALFHAIRSQTTDDWSAMSTWDQYKMQYFNDCTANPVIPSNITIPAFTNDFPGWVQSTNWIIRQFAPDVTFGWQENLWSIGSANWVHQTYDAATLKSQISDPTAAAIAATSAYSGAYQPDFIVFDKYEMDSIPSSTGIGYLFNARDWSNILSYVKNISESLGTVPVMLWQIPGGHLQVTNDINTRVNHASTEPDFFFGDAANPLPNLQSFITNTALPASIYGTTSIATYLSMNESGVTGSYAWQTNHMQAAANSHVFAILWGGGNTTSVGTFPSNDNGWLANKIINYYKNPMPTLANVKRAKSTIKKKH